MTISAEGKRLCGTLLIAISIDGSRDASAQTRSTMTGTIRDGAGAALPGVAVSLVSPSLPGNGLTNVTNARGLYRFVELPAGLYELTATLQGLQTAKRTELRVPVGTTLTVDLRLTTGEVTDVVTLSGAGPMVDVTTPALSAKLSIEDLENLPITGAGALLQLVPGATPSPFGGGGDTSQFKVDGSPITVILTGSAPSAALNIYWLEEAQIVGLGAGAEHGDVSGVVANLAIRSGSNRFSGLLYYRTTRPQWVADNTGSLPEALRGQFPPEQILSRWGSDAQIGGPIIRGRLFFFSGFQYGRNKVVQPGRIGNVPLDSRSPAALTRLSWVPSQRLSVDGFIQASRNRSKGNLGRNALPETADDSTTRIRSWNARANWALTPSLALEMRSGGPDYQSSNIPADRRAGPPPRRDTVTGIASGNAQSFSDQFADRNITGASLTWFTDGFAAQSHDVEVGFEFERMRHRRVSGIPGGRSYQDAAGIAQQVTFSNGASIEGTGTRTTLYVQDAWRATSRLSIHPGLRLALNRGSVPDNGTVFKTNPVSPRIGLAWDVGADHKTVMRAAYGRLHEGLYTTAFDFRNVSGVTPNVIFRVLADGTLQEINRTAPANGAVDDNLAHAYVDQYLAGIEREMFPDFSLSAQYIRRNFEDIWALVDTGSRYAPVERRDPGPDGRLGTSDDGALLTVFNLLNQGQAFRVLTNPGEAFRRYDAFQVVGQKRYSRRWQLLAAYTWSKTRGNVSAGNGENRASGGDTGGGGVFYNPNRRINAEGPSGSDFTHQVNVQGSHFLPAWGGVGFSGGYRYSSGGPWGRIANITGLSQGLQVVRIEPRGTRRNEASHQLDVRLEKTFPLGSRRTLGIYADVFNLTNRGAALGAIEISGDTFGQPANWTGPRTAQVTGRIKF